jgi:DNA repair exonuclease SbcCD ATPase subunit
VTVEFVIGTVEYKIVRGIKPNIFEIWQDGRQLNQESHSRDYQKLLETNILKLNHKSFHQVVVLGSSNFIPFMQLTTYQRRGVIEDLLDIGVFTKMNIVLKEISAKQKDLIRDTEHQLNLFNEKIKLQSKHLNDLRQIDARNAKKIQDEINELLLVINELTQANLETDNKYAAEYQEAKSKFDKLQIDLNKLSQYEHSIEVKIKGIVDDARFYDINDICPTCSQAISNETKAIKRHACKDRAAELNKGYIELKEAIAALNKELKRSSATMNELSKLPSLVSSNNNIITSHNARVRSLACQLQSNDDSANADRAKEALDKSRETKISLSDLRLTQIEERTYSEVIAELLKDTGIKTKIIKQYLPVMNKLINQYLQILDFFVSFNLDDNFNETIKSRHRDDFSYASFSEGEKARINLSLMFAWRYISKMKNSANTNLLVLDEVFDSSLDVDGVENLMKILKTLDSSTRVFVITHKPDSFENSFERKLTAHKNGNFSTITEEMLSM